MSIVTREQWGARPPARPPLQDQLPYPRVWLHHSTGPTGGAERARAIQADHLSRGWRDAAYQWLVGLDATYEGIRGRHLNEDRGHSAAICLVGNFETHELPESMVAETAWLVAHGLLAGWWTSGITGGHRDLEPTACPGRHAYAAIPTINARAAAIIHSLSEEDDMADPRQIVRAPSGAVYLFDGVELRPANNLIYRHLLRHSGAYTGNPDPDVDAWLDWPQANIDAVPIAPSLADVAHVRQLADAAATPAEVASVVDAAVGALVAALDGLVVDGQPVTADTVRRLLIELLEQAA